GGLQLPLGVRGGIREQRCHDPPRGDLGIGGGAAASAAGGESEGGGAGGGTAEEGAASGNAWSWRGRGRPVRARGGWRAVAGAAASVPGGARARGGGGGCGGRARRAGLRSRDRTRRWQLISRGTATPRKGDRPGTVSTMPPQRARAASSTSDVGAWARPSSSARPNTLVAGRR